LVRQSLNTELEKNKKQILDEVRSLLKGEQRVVLDNDCISSNFKILKFLKKL